MKPDASATAPPAGNVYDKYHSRNPVARLLVRGFLNTYRGMLERCPRPRRALEIGCGEGELLLHLGDIHHGVRITALDLDLGVVREAAERVLGAGLLVADASRLPLPREAFDLVICCEVLEHLPDPAGALADIRRVLEPGGTLLSSVPREPIWRALNMARGAYLGELGNTPGHLQHFSRRSFVRLLERAGFRVEEVRTPLPWTFVRSSC